MVIKWLDSLGQWLNAGLQLANDFLYSYLLIGLLVLAGIYFTVRTRGVQLRLLGEGIRLLREPKANDKSISSLQALLISTASRVGTGNIAGVASAIAVGGPGAVFWMWLLAIIGGASAFIESTLAQVYKVRDGEGFRGGPAYYIQYGLGKRSLGVVFALALIACFGFGFNGLQSFNAASALGYYFADASAKQTALWVAGIVMAVLTAVVIFGGASRIVTIATVLVPVMAAGYLILGLWIIALNIELLPQVMALIFTEAFNGEAIFGGFAGSCVVLGIKRGLFSNEAGMGSAPNAAAAADVTHPAKQGLVQMLSVFIDTLIICSITALMLLISGIEGSEALKGMDFVQSAVFTHTGLWGMHFVTFSIWTFAFSSIIGNYFYAENNLAFISGNKLLLMIFRLAVVLMVLVGALSDFTFIWNLADVLMGIMATINIVAILLLGDIALKVLADYQRQRQKGQDPRFWARTIGLSDTPEWRE